MKEKNPIFMTKLSEISHILDDFLVKSEKLMEPLKELEGNQLTAVSSCVVLVSAIRTVEQTFPQLGKTYLGKLKATMLKVSPKLSGLLSPAGPCWTLSVSYAQELAKCEGEGRGEDECWEAHGYGGAAVMCVMKELEKLRKEWAIDIPPRPTPNNNPME